MNIQNLNIFRFYRDKNEFIKQLSNSDLDIKIAVQMFMTTTAFLIIYGLVIGFYHSVMQALSAAAKLPVMFILGILICFPTFYIIQIIVGSKIKLKNLLTIILAGALLSSWIMLAFLPIIIFFMLTGGNYYFMQLLHIAVMAFSSVFGMKLIIEALKYNCETENIYPKTGVTVFRISVIIFLFVTIQLGWNLKPFMSKKTEKFQIFRQYDGNFYTAILYSFDNLMNPQNEKKTDSVFLKKQFLLKDLK